MRCANLILVFMLAVALCPALASAQTATVTRNVNLRRDPSAGHAPIRLLTHSEPPLELLHPTPEHGFYHVKTSAGEDGYVWSRNVRVSTSPTVPAESFQPGPGVPGSASLVGCGDGLWRHVYHPSRLLVKQDCVTVTGVIVDATAHQSRHQRDGVRHEKDGDTHGWLKVDPQFANLINAGNSSFEEDNLVFEMVCRYKVTQPDAKPACAGFHDTTELPAVGTHVEIRGTFVQEKNHGKWDEIHPVSSIKVR
ncbi:MAG: SH3 domain-containing protein [Acidobacteriia bacterium]|nr:SH3 domain-containing protein [Terriglobia bacterium]